MSQNIKQIIIAIIIIIVAFFGFQKFFVSPDSNSTTTLVADKTNSAQTVNGQSILVTLNRLNSVTLDGSLFSDKVFVSLVPFERTLEPQVPGRRNPFQSIGNDTSGLILPQSTSSASVRR